MTPNRKQDALVMELIERLRAHGSWAGETHVQKTAYFLKELANVPLNLDYVLYRHGPYSFDLHEELSFLMTDGMIKAQYSSDHYGPHLILTERGKKWKNIWGENYIDNFTEKLEKISSFVGSKNVRELEKISTALFMTLKHNNKNDKYLARRINELKPHIKVNDALDSIVKARDIVHQWNN